jgi:hypothetical protein
MGGGLLQLVAYGAQDAYISGNPQITFWKGLFKRHTNFAMEAFRVNFAGQAAWGTKQTALIGRHADLLYSTYVEVALPKLGLPAGDPKTQTNFEWNNDNSLLGFNLVKYAELDVGGQIVDRSYSEFMVLWYSLSSEFRKFANLQTMSNAGAAAGAAVLPYDTGCDNDGRQRKLNVCYIPIPFFFTRNPGAALPLIALQYHEVKINIIWNDPEFISGNFSKANIARMPPPVQAALYVDYIYLDTEERRRMAQASHEYLIEQTQFNEEKGIVGANNRIDLTFNHPVKELFWTVQPSRYTNCRLAAGADPALTRLQPFNYGDDPVYEQFIQINGQDRMSKRFGDYFNKVQAFQHHTGAPLGPGTYSYSFAIRPEEHQPSGTCNFSRIDSATIVMTMAGGYNFNKHPPPTAHDAENNWDVRVYAINYNVLRVMSGMGGLAYSN